MAVDVDESSFSFQGCRDNRVSFNSATSSPDFISFKKRESNQRNRCLIDYDDTVVDYLRSCSKIDYKENKGYTIKDDYGNGLVSCDPFDWWL